MLRTISTLLVLLASLSVFSQNIASQSSSSSKMARVNVVVADMNGKPSKGEQVLFKNNTNARVVSGVSDAEGKINLELPPGAAYTITVKSITDSTKYGTLTIPALKPDEFFNDPFKVNIKFEAARTYTLKNVHFDIGKATLRPASFPALEELFGYLKNKEDIKVEIAGHTDNTGRDSTNLKLSQLRAETIRDYLIKKGIPSPRISAKGYGSTEPVADNATEEGRQLNRRTEVRIL